MSNKQSYGRDDIWIPGQFLNHEYPTATTHELAHRLGEMVTTRTIGLDGMLGAVRIPESSEAIKGIASVDLCEVVRGTVKGMTAALGREYVGNDYSAGLWGDAQNTVDLAVKDSMINSLAHVLMNNGYILPVENIDSISALMRRWRNEEGVYCIANTSTLAGNELATLDFLDTYMPNCFDGIAFPRNHNGRGTITKAAAVSEVNTILTNYDQAPQYTAHIDDVEHHVATMVTRPPLPITKVFVPLRHYRPDHLPVDSNIGNDDARRIAQSLVESTRESTSIVVHPEYMAMDSLIMRLPNVVRAEYPLDAFVKMDQFIGEMR